MKIDFDIKSLRLLYLLDKLKDGEILYTNDIMNIFSISKRTFLRYIDTLNLYFYSMKLESSVIYKPDLKGYVLDHPSSAQLTSQEILAIIKIILESRAFSENDRKSIFDKLLMITNKEDKKLISDIIGNESICYVETGNNKPLLKILWDMCLAVRNHQVIYAEYTKITDTNPKSIIIEPLGVVFSEFYFYLIAHYHDKNYEYPAVFRLDRFPTYTITSETFYVRYIDRFQEGEFRKRVQFMNIDKLLTIEFEFWGRSHQAVLDRLPTAREIGRNDNRIIYRAEIYGKGVKMWLLSQGEFLKVISPLDFAQEMKDTITAMMSLYL